MLSLLATTATTSADPSALQTWGIPAIFAVAGIIAGLFSQYALNGPKVRFNHGSGTSGVGGFQFNWVSASNSPGRLGISLGDTKILGVWIFRKRDIYIPVARQTASSCTAVLYEDSKNGPYVPIGLLWKTPDGPDAYSGAMNFPSNHTAELMMFAQQNSDKSKYFVFRPDGASELPQVPVMKYEGDKDFIVKLNYENRKRYTKFSLVQDRLTGDMRIVQRRSWLGRRVSKF